MRFKRKPEFVHAVQWTGENKTEMWELFNNHTNNGGYISTIDQGLRVRGSLDILSSDSVDVGDYVLADERGYCWIMKPDAFENLYERMGDDIPQEAS